MSWKKFVPPSHLVPGMIVLGAVGAVLVSAVLPKTMAWIAAQAAKLPKVG